MQSNYGGKKEQHRGTQRFEVLLQDKNPISSLQSKPDSAANSSQAPLISGLCMATVTDDECSTNNSAAVGLGFSALPIL